MSSLDAIFTSSYSAAQRSMLQRVKQSGLIVVAGGDLLLYLDGRLVERSSTNTPAAYNDLKIIDHIPLAVFVLLVSDAETGTLSHESKLRVREYIEALEALDSSLTQARFPAPGSLGRQREIQQASLALLRQAERSGKISRPALDAFARSQRSAIEANFPGAARAQLASIDRTIRRWRTERLTNEQWDSMRVVILGASTAHRRELHLQYFSEVLDVPMQGTDRLLYYEGNDPEGALDLVGRFRLDGEVSRAFFDDPTRMFSDIFAETARAWLAERQHPKAGTSKPRPTRQGSDSIPASDP